LLEGKNVNLRLTEKEDLPLFAEWFNSAEWFGQYSSPSQYTLAGLEEWLNSAVFETKVLVIEKKDGGRVGYVWHFSVVAPYMKMLEIGYGLVASERRKGYGTEAAQLIVDYLFLTRNIARIQATTHPKNAISQRVLEKVGFRREGIMRKPHLIRGEWTDLFIFSILREEWKEPKILTRPTSEKQSSS